MKLKGKVEAYLKSLMSEGRVLHFSLFDPEKIHDLNKLYQTAKILYDGGTSAFLIGGTLGVSQRFLDSVLEILEDFDIPKILFPSNINLISDKADAILFMSMLNSDELYYVIGAQVIAAPLVKLSGLEALPTAYIIIGHGGTAAHVGRARPIPYENVSLAIAYALTAELLGMRYVYLEAGSGAPEPVRPEMVKAVKEATNVTLIVGGGIRSAEKAVELAKAGANIIVTGNIIEKDEIKAIQIIKAISGLRIRNAVE
ncbi:MAG: geranylgeranylglyceryl/heptaprenylglyceryl phosphate synthase [Sulfolobales archaeon]|nr:geranylgeranylglyceryl/heptaprenylglyceryl phosphate synthase [Sulfolobales archaeon]